MDRYNAAVDHTLPHGSPVGQQVGKFLRRRRCHLICELCLPSTKNTLYYSSGREVHLASSDCRPFTFACH